MDMIGRKMPLQNIDALPPTFFAHNISNPFRHHPSEDFVTILGDPDDVDMNRKNRVRPVTMFFHCSAVKKENAQAST